MDKAIALVVVRRGVAEAYTPEHVDVRVADMDALEDGIPELPSGVGFEELAAEAGLAAGRDVLFVQDPELLYAVWSPLLEYLQSLDEMQRMEHCFLDKLRDAFDEESAVRGLAVPTHLAGGVRERLLEIIGPLDLEDSGDRDRALAAAMSAILKAEQAWQGNHA